MTFIAHSVDYVQTDQGVMSWVCAGVIPITHNSGGPKEDIVEPSGPACCGFLCDTSQEFSESIQKVATMPLSRRQTYIKNARRCESFVIDGT